MKDRVVSERIGAALRKRREASGLSQDTFAAEIGMHRAYYGSLERGEVNLTLKTLRRICTGLRAKVWEVLREADI